ncbi:MAG: hypothetical protein AAAFM81_13205, partial [Pseudomonadota bacterium]
IYRQLAAQRPDAFLPDLAGSLNNLGIRLDALGRREEALDTNRESVRLTMPFFQSLPQAFLRDLQLRLSSYIERLNKNGIDLETDEVALEAQQALESSGILSSSA